MIVVVLVVILILIVLVIKNNSMIDNDDEDAADLIAYLKDNKQYFRLLTCNYDNNNNSF